MEDIELNIINNTPEDQIRVDENWSDETESLAKTWMVLSNEISKKHAEAAGVNKFKNAITGLPSILIPAIFAPLTTTLKDYENVEYISMAGFIATGILIGINTFFRYAQKYQGHLDFSSRYLELVTDIQYELAKSRKFRTPPDAYLMKIQLRLDSLRAQEPD